MILRLISGRPTRIIGWHSDGKRPILGRIGKCEAR